MKQVICAIIALFALSDSAFTQTAGTRTHLAGWPAANSKAYSSRVRKLAAVMPQGPTYRAMKVFYATDRVRSKNPGEFYSGERTLPEQMSYGVCEVSIPQSHQRGVMERAGIWSVTTFWRNKPEKHIVALKADEMDNGSFLEAIRARVADSNQKEAFVFVHGYNVSFEEATRRTAQLACDIGFEGAPILYSWPSQACFSCYTADESTIDWTTAHLKNFLQDIAAKSGASTIHLIGHSMGNRALTRALESMAGQSMLTRQFRQVVLAAPDVDNGVFAQLAHALTRTCARVTVYASSHDEALRASFEFHRGLPRVGWPIPAVLIVPGIDMIDISALPTGLLGHSYFAENISVLDDILHLFREGRPPHERCGIIKRQLANDFYWLFDRARAATCSTN